MPKKGRNKEKELPLLTVQGVLRLEKSFQKAQHDDATTVVVKKREDAEPEMMKLVPGQSEHEFVHYKMGYDIGPANPNPVNEMEAELLEEQRKLEAKTEAFEEMKKRSEEERKERMERYRREHGLTSDAVIKPEDLDPDNPKNYFLPIQVAANINDDLPPGEEDSRDGVGSTKSFNPQSPENVEVDPSLVPTMKPLPDELQFGPEMVLSVALEMEEKRRKMALKERSEGRVEVSEDVGEEVCEEEEDGMIYSLDEMAAFHKKEEDEQKTKVQGPEISDAELVQSAQDQDGYDAKAVLESYWAFVKENPRDFNGWTYLLQHVETTDVLDEIRTAYNAFLPLYPYCYAYWMRYSDCEKRHSNWARALAILHRGLEAIPLSVELWLYYLELYHKMYKESPNFDALFNSQCERAVQTVGLDYRSDVIWERFIEWELDRKNLKNVTAIYRRLVGIPTKLYNRHWDNFIAHVRDHHPRDILEYDEYEELRKLTCEELDLTYRPDPIRDSTKTVKDVTFPEDKLKAGMKERIVASVVAIHERCEQEVNKRSSFENKIKRTYFHVRPLDLKQLKNWDAYLDFEMGEGHHERIVVLFERCLIPAAGYEQFWAKYARYLELHDKNENPNPNSMANEERTISDLPVNPLKRAKWFFGTGLITVEELREKRCTWTLRGWKETDKEGNDIMVAEEIPKEKDKEVVDAEVESQSQSQNVETENGISCDAADKISEKEIESEMTEVCKTSWTGQGREAVRDVYRRACLVHCPAKAMIKMKWATFEEEIGDLDAAKEILTELNKKFPLLLECCIQLADMERRSNNFEVAEDLYKKLMKRIPQNRKHIKTWVALKLARFQFKVWSQPDKALATLRSAVKKERGDPRLYSQIIDICYQRQPIDVKGVTAAIEIALVSLEMSNMQKLEFVKRKVEFMQEFGDVRRYRDACEQLKQFRKLCALDLRADAKRKKELEKEEQKLKELEEFRAQTRANANLKAKIAETEGRLMCSQCQVAMFPDDFGEYEFEKMPQRRQPGESGAAHSRDDHSHAGPSNPVDEDGILDLMEMEIPEDQEEQIKKNLQEKTKYKEVAPTWELNIETYGYGKRRKTYDPDYEHVESAKFREYERLEIVGYDEELKDEDRGKLRSLPAPGLGSEELKRKQRAQQAQDPEKFTASDYVVPPKVPQLVSGPSMRKGIERKETEEREQTVFVLPQEIADPSKSPCVNVPDWFVKEGGELCLSDTSNGLSVIRYWPKFLSEKGNNLMFNRLRKYCKWHQKQVKIGGEWKYETRLVAWYGPCDYIHSGLTLEKNLNWAPELLDLLHRLIAMTRHEFNSCFMNLYRHGHDMCGWHADVHPQLGRNPPVASVSLGAVRVFEFRKKSGPPNFIRFPLFPGSLLLMEGATQEDWFHCLPRDISCKEERINLTFRTMYSIDKRNG